MPYPRGPGLYLPLSGATASERANSQLFLCELCDILSVPRPDPHRDRGYNDLGWGGSANVRAIHEAAKAWYEKFDRRKLPLNDAYEFARNNDLGEEAQRIKDSPAR